MSNNNYVWLHNEPGPKILKEALKILGTKEVVGTGNNPEILRWAKELNLENVYKADSIPWCGLAIAYVVKQAGYTPVAGPLWALNWNKFGAKVDEAQLGDILTFTRKGGGHVGIYVGEDNQYYHVLGGNQNDEFNIMRISKSRLSNIRRPIFKIGKPKNVRKIYLNAVGEISKNEA